MSELADFIPAGQLTEPEFRQWIFEIEGRMLQRQDACDRHTEDSPFKLDHVFTTGLYTREIFMPKGSLVISRIHIHEHPFVVTQGEVSVYDGKDIVRLVAPYRGITKPGTKRILYVHEDTVWTTFHVTDKKTMEEVDENGVITCDTFEDFERISHKEITL